VHTALIALHAAAGVMALGAGAIAIRRASSFGVYLWSLVVCIAALAAVVVYDWEGLEAGTRVLFLVFVVFGAYMIRRAVVARRCLAAPSAERRSRYLDNLGFTLVALFDAFLVIAVLDLGAPGWLTAVAGVAVAVAGHRWIGRLKERGAAPVAAGPARARPVGHPRRERAPRTGHVPPYRGRL